MESLENAPKRQRGRPRGWDDKTAQNTIKSLDRALEVFEHLSERAGGTLTEIADDLGQSPATVYRILVTLQTRGFAEFDAASQVWAVGARAYHVGAAFLRRSSLVESARPVLRRLMEETGETANLGVLRGASVLFVSQAETDEPIRAFFPPGTMSPMHASGIGKAVMSQMAERRLASLLAGGKLTRFTPHTLTDVHALIADLTLSRERGYAIDGEEKNLGMRCIAAPVFDAAGQAVAGISVSGPTSRVGEGDTQRLSTAVMRAADDLTRAIGG